MHNSSSKIYQEEDEYYLMREIAIKRKQIENKQKELMLLRKKQYDNFNINKSIQTAIDSYITSLRSNEYFLTKQQIEINKREQWIQKKEYVLNKVLQLNTVNDEEIYKQRKEYLKKTIDSIKQSNLKVTGGGIVLMNKEKNSKMKMKKKKISNLIIDKAANITIKKTKQRAKTVNIQKRNKDNTECKYENISDSYLRTLMINGNKKNKAKDIKQTIQSTSSIGNVTRNSTITHHSIDVKHKLNKSFKEIENLILEYDNYCKKTTKTNANNDKKLVSSQSMKTITDKKILTTDSHVKKRKQNIMPNTSRDSSLNKSIKKEKIPKPITPIKHIVKNPKPIQTIPIKSVKKENKNISKSQIKSNNKWKANYQKEKEKLLTLRAKTLENIKKEKEKEKIQNKTDNSIILKESLKENVIVPKEKKKPIQVPSNNNIIPLKSKRKRVIREIKIDNNERNKSTTPRKGKVIRLYSPSPVVEKESPILIQSIEEKKERNNKSSLYTDSSNLLSEYEKLSMRKKEEENNNSSLNLFISPVSQNISKSDSMIKSPVSQFSIITPYNYHNIETLFNKLKSILFVHSEQVIKDAVCSHISHLKLYNLLTQYERKKVYVNPIEQSFYIMMKNSISSIDYESNVNCSEVDYEAELNKMKEITKETQNIEKDLIAFSNNINEEYNL